MYNRVIRALWGDLEGEELKKFGVLALGFFLLIGSFWPLKTLKESVFINMIGADFFLPLAKIISLVLFFPLVVVYTTLFDYLSKERMIFLFVTIYAALGFICTYFLAHPVIGLANDERNPWRLLGWLFYLLVESYASLMVALYWSFINGITTPEAAKKGYGMLIFGTQLGGLIFTIFAERLSHDATHYAQTAPLIACLSFGLLVLFGVTIFFFTRFFRYRYVDFVAPEMVEKKRVSFFEGAKLIVRQPYVGGIFALVSFQEIVATIMAFQMYLLVESTYLTPGLRNKFLFGYALVVQLVASLFALLGTSFVQRRFSLMSSLISYPLVLGVAISLYVMQPSLYLVAGTMVLAKALGYALNQPAKEILYIPTPDDVKYKSKGWIDMFGARFAKGAASYLNSMLGKFPVAASSVALALIFCWSGVAYSLGRAFQRIMSRR